MENIYDLVPSLLLFPFSSTNFVSPIDGTCLQVGEAVLIRAKSESGDSVTPFDQ